MSEDLNPPIPPEEHVESHPTSETSDDEASTQAPEELAPKLAPNTESPAPEALVPEPDGSIPEPAALTPGLPSLTPEQADQLRRTTRRSFTAAALASAAGYGIFRWISYSTADGDQPLPRRRLFQANAKLSQAIFDERGLAPTFPVSRSEKPRANGRIGLKQDILPEQWRLQLVGVENASSRPHYVNDVTAWEYAYKAPKRSDDPDSTYDLQDHPEWKSEGILIERAGKPHRGLEEAGLSQSTLASGTPGLLLPLSAIVSLPRHELVTEFKCIEGWSQIIHFAGVRMADFIQAYPPARKPDGSFPRYVYMETPNGDYYVGYDLNVCLHPQTLLVTEMAGEPLTQIHGAPLRLHAPTKYGYKQIKRIGMIAYTDLKPDDYWTKLGYDWYAGL